MTTDNNTDDSGESETSTDDQLKQTPGQGKAPEAEPIEPESPEEFGLVQVWWGNGKGKTTAALGMGFRAAGHGYRVHMLQFMKGGASSVDATRGEYNAIAAMPGFTYENTGHYGWHGLLDGSADEEHQARAMAALKRTEELLAELDAGDIDSSLPLDGPPEDGVHLLILDEILYAANRSLIDPEAVVSLVESKPDGLELVLTGGHETPDYLIDNADLITEVRKEKHPFDAGHRARQGTEY